MSKMSDMQTKMEWKSVALILVMVLIACIVLVVNATDKPDRAEVKEIVRSEVDCEWKIDKGGINKAMENQEKTLYKIDARQQTLIRDVSSIDSKMDILLQRSIPK